MLGEKIVLGCCDVYGAGVQALASLEPNPGDERVWEAVRLEGTADFIPVFVGAEEDMAASAVVMKHLGKGPAERPKVTCLLINAAVPSGSLALFVDALLKYVLSELGPTTFELFVVGAMRVHETMKTEGPYVASLCGGMDLSQSKGLEALPQDCKVPDPLLAMLFHFLVALQIPTTCILAPGFKLGPKDDISSRTLPTIQLLSSIVAEVLGCSFSAHSLRRLKATRRWDRRDSPSDANIMYL